jgi:hypothetical protein
MFFLASENKGELYVYDSRSGVGTKVHLSLELKRDVLCGYQIKSCTQQSRQGFRRTVNPNGIALDGYIDTVSNFIGKQIMEKEWPNLEGRTLTFLRERYSGL